MIASHADKLVQLRDEFNTTRDTFEKEKEEPNRLAKANDNIAAGVRNLKQELEKMESTRKHTSEMQDKAHREHESLSNTLEQKFKELQEMKRKIQDMEIEKNQAERDRDVMQIEIQNINHENERYKQEKEDLS